MSFTLTASVIVPAYNAESTIGSCLHALAAQVYDDAISLEIIIIDDASTDQTPTIAASFDGVRVVTQLVNQGRSAARNAGAAAASGDILLFTDADCRPTPTWAQHMLQPFHDPTVIGVKGAYYCDQDEPVARFTQLELEDKYDELARHEQISFIDTYAAAYRRDVFLANNGFDQSLSWSLLEDQDFSFRLAAKGHKMVFVPEARVYHRHVTKLLPYYRRKWMIGRWKTVILRRHPERRDNDSRTPLTLKAQFGLAILLTGLIPIGLIFRQIRPLVLALLGTFIASTLPFHLKTAEHDPRLLPTLLPLLFLRAFGLAHGYIDGTLTLRNHS